MKMNVEFECFVNDFVFNVIASCDDFRDYSAENLRIKLVESNGEPLKRRVSDGEMEEIIMYALEELNQQNRLCELNFDREYR